MECLGKVLVLVPCLWECSTKHAANIMDLEDNLESLRSEILKLKNMSQDVRNRVREAEQPRMKRTNQVNGWLESVESVVKEVDEIINKGTRELEKRCLKSCCSNNCKSSYQIGKEVAKMIPQVTRLTEEGKFDVVADKLAPPLVEELPMENVVVGFESKFEEVWQSVQNKDTAVIGLVGIGGVGKTTLLKQLNNQFLKATHEYGLVIWIVVSRPVNLGKIQASFQNRLNIPDHLWDNKSEGERAILISEKLKLKKFVVLLDDMWERLELSEVGIPQPSSDNMSKVVFTTRSRKVYNSMEALKLIDVNCLPPKQAFSLFCSKVGEDVLKCHPEMMRLVNDVARECQGLPLALITIGRSMRGKTDIQQWKDAKTMLEKYPSTFPDVEGQVFSKLVFSYDTLPTPTLKKCFEYCSLYPEDHNIAKDEIIMLWIAERLIDEYNSMPYARVQGRQIVESLMQAGLLEAGYGEETVKMHDVIRDMSLWLACERGEKKNKILVDVVTDVSDDISATPNAMTKWRTNVEKVSLWGRGTTVKSLAGLSYYSNLVTLIVRDTWLKELSDEIFRSMNVLKVLDLSGNRQLESLPGKIGCLASLEYLNIMMTDVIRLPVEVKQLKKLGFLMVTEWTIIPRTVISSLRLLLTFEQEKASGLRLLKMSRKQQGKASEYDVWEGDRISMEKLMLEELEGLEHIMHLRLILTSSEGMQKLLNSPKLQSCTSHLSLATLQGSLPVELDLSTRALTKHLEKLHVWECDASVIKLGRSTFCSNIIQISFSRCPNVRNLNSLVYVPNLCFLDVIFCGSMEELIGEEAEETLSISLFSRLTRLALQNLPKLSSICLRTALPFPSLKLMSVKECNRLGRLPFDSNTANTIPQEFRMEGSMWWWNELRWDSPETKDVFTPKFVSLLMGSIRPA